MASPAEMQAELAALRAEVLALKRARDDQQSLLRAIADYAPIVLYATDLAGRFTLSNRLHASLLGLDEREVLGASEAELLGAEVAAQVQAVADEVARTGEPFIAELEIPLHGVPRMFLEHVFPLRDGETIAGIGGAAIDITERKHAEDEARVFAALAEHSPDGILVRPLAEHGPVRVNHALRRLLGLPADAPAERAAGWFPDGVSGPMKLSRGDGEALSLELSSFTIPGASGEPAATATIVRDVTRLQRALRDREQQAEHNRRQQEELIAELSAPLLPLAPGVLVLPLIGSLDEARSVHVREVVLEGILRHRSRVLILDLTGLRAVDGTPADRLRGLVDAVRLVGARVILTGIRPAVAAALVEVGLAMGRGLTVLGTLEDAVRMTVARPGPAGPGTRAARR